MMVPLLLSIPLAAASDSWPRVVSPETSGALHGFFPPVS
jgi:hypothetical protein